MTRKKSDGVRSNSNPGSEKSKPASSDVIEELLKDTGGWFISMPLRPPRAKPSLIGRPERRDGGRERRNEMTEEKEVKKGESKVADAAWLRDTAERHRAFAGNSGGWFIGRTFTIDDFRDDEKEKKEKKE